jgi:hypothetical protein
MDGKPWTVRLDSPPAPSGPVAAPAPSSGL